MMMRMRRTKSRHCRTTTKATKKICIFSAARSGTGGWRQLRSEEEELEDRIVDLEFEAELFERGGLLDQLQANGAAEIWDRRIAPERNRWKREVLLAVYRSGTIPDVLFRERTWKLFAPAPRDPTGPGRPPRAPVQPAVPS